MSMPRSTCPVLAIAAVGWSPSATAAAVAQPVQEASFFGELVSIVLPLAFIILGLFVILHLARRRYGMGGRGVALQVVQILPLGPRERLVMVKTRTGRVFAVGVSAQSVNLVSELDPADAVEPEPAAAQASRSAPNLLASPLSLRDLGARLRNRPDSGS